MSIETSKAIARVVATEIIKEHGKNVDLLLVSEYIYSEVPGLEHHKADEVEALALTYIKIANVHVSISDLLVNDDGSLKTKEELEKDLDDQVVGW